MSEHDDERDRDDETLQESTLVSSDGEEPQPAAPPDAEGEDEDEAVATPDTEDDEEDEGDAAGEASAPPTQAGDEVVEAKPKSKSKGKSKSGESKLVSNLVFALGFLLTLVLGYFVGQWFQIKFGDKPQPEAAERYRVELRGDEPQRGPDDALVTIIEFADFQCPYCADSVEPLEEAMGDYEGDVRLIFKHYPLSGHTRAAPAAYTSWAAHQQGQFWVFHDRLFEDKASIENVPEWVAEFDLDASKFGADMESPEARQDVDQDMLSGSKIGVTGTPAFVVNGHMYKGKRGAIDWRKIIEAELDYAKEIADDNDLERGEVYAFLMKDALERQVGAPDRGPRKKRPRREGEPDDVSVYAVPVEGAPAKGPADALVTIVEFADYHCPFCAQVKQDVDRLLEEHPDELRLVYRQRPLAMHEHARDASLAALAAGKQGKFWEMHDILFLRQLQSYEQFAEAAEELGLDLEQFEADYESEELAGQLAEDQRIAAQFGVRGTPAFFINGRYLSGAQGYGVLSSIFEERLAEAKTLVQGGTPASEIYEKLTGDGKTKVE